jgi:hypothetical protein
MIESEREIRGVWTRGEEPQELVLSDGSRIHLHPAERGKVVWERSETEDGRADRVLSMREALELAGADFADYVTVRTRTEAAWLRAVAEWCEVEAGRLEGELGAV